MVAERRSVSFTNHADGEAALSIQGSGDRVYLAWIVIDTLARKLRSTGDERTLDELRHDIALDLILGKFNSHIQVQAFLHVPALTLAGIGDDPGILAGYGPVTAARCRQLASRDAMWHRVFCDPVTGVVKDLDRKTYRPPASLARYVEVRDGTCVAPGCQRPADRCQLDHTLRWAVGCGIGLESLRWACLGAVPGFYSPIWSGLARVTHRPAPQAGDLKPGMRTVGWCVN